MVARDRPQPEIAEPTALQNTARLESLERALRGIRICLGAAHDLVCVELLAGYCGEEGEDARGCLTADERVTCPSHVQILYDHILIRNG